MTRAGRAITGLFIFVIVALIAAGVSFFRGGVGSRGTPSAMESMAAREIRHMAIPADARRLQNPVARSPEAIHEGMMHFADHCAICHDNDGSGQTMIGGGLYPKPPDLRNDQTQKLSDGEIFWIIENGVRFTGMPAFGGQRSQEDSWKLVHFIRHLPQLKEEEGMEMERNNPKGPEDREEEEQEQEFLKGGAVQQKSGSGHHH